MIRLFTAISTIALSATLFACGGGDKTDSTTPATTEPAAAEPAPAAAETPPAGETPPEAPAAPPGPTVAEQVDAGQGVWADSCAGCHGNAGEGKGKKNPPVVGDKALSKVKTAAELEAYIKEKMPKDDPGTLSDEQAWAVTAWILSKNGKMGEAALSADNGASVSVH